MIQPVLFVAVFGLALTGAALSTAEQSAVPRWAGLLLLALVYAVLIGLRHPLTGSDTPNYVGYMTSLSDATLAEVLRRFWFAPSYLFWYLAWASAKLGATPQTYVFIVALVSLALLARGLWLMGESDRREGILMWVMLFAAASSYLMYGNVLRQAMAFSLMAVVLGHLMNGRGFRAFVLTILGVLFHRSMMVFVLLVPISLSRILKTRHLKTIAILAPILSPIVIAVVASAGIPVISDRVAAYQQRQSSLLTYVRIALLYGSIFFYDVVLLKTELLDGRHERLFRLLLLITAVSSLSVAAPLIAERFVLYTTLFHVGFLASMFARTRWRDVWLGLAVPVLMVLLGASALYPGVQVNYVYGL